MFPFKNYYVNSTQWNLSYQTSLSSGKPLYTGHLLNSQTKLPIPVNNKIPK